MSTTMNTTTVPAAERALAKARAAELKARARVEDLAADVTAGAGRLGPHPDQLAELEKAKAAHTATLAARCAARDELGRAREGRIK